MNECTIHVNVNTDVNNDKVRHGPSYWKMNNSLLNMLKDEEYVDNINKLISDTSENYTDHLSKQSLWDFCKKQVKDFLAHPAGRPMSSCHGEASVVRRPASVVRPHFTQNASSSSLLDQF